VKKYIRPQDVILVSKEGYEMQMAKIQEEIARYNQSNSEGNEERHRNRPGENYETSLQDQERIKHEGMIEYMCGILERMQIIEDTTAEENLVNIGDIVNIQFAGDDELRKIKLVASMPEFGKEDEITEISINAPMAQAIYKQPIGAIVTYSVSDKRTKSKYDYTIMIVSKERGLEQEPKQKQPGEE